ncbi:unnamed protein product [Porites lobata]|uniref:Uncharacterized protein n=1 Tax=Porites lobata TaxID=104759 RepID=A0ABN8N938_9CNID|nr:unnamed protein product [Porites lobata]
MSWCLVVEKLKILNYLKGFDVAGRAIAALKDTRLVFVGATEGKHEEIAQRLKNSFSGVKMTPGIEDDSFIPKKSVPPDIEDRDFKVEYKVQDVGLLHAVTKSGNIEIIASLLSQGFEVDSKDREGVTPLM